MCVLLLCPRVQGCMAGWNDLEKCHPHPISRRGFPRSNPIISLAWLVRSLRRDSRHLSRKIGWTAEPTYSVEFERKFSTFFPSVMQYPCSISVGLVYQALPRGKALTCSQCSHNVDSMIRSLSVCTLLVVASCKRTLCRLCRLCSVYYCVLLGLTEQVSSLHNLQLQKISIRGCEGGERKLGNLHYEMMLWSFVGHVHLSFRLFMG